ncbi:MAG: 16S rRNA (uracil(1498)-N(3))-methyltransferase [Oceanospirillaceae bacterium]|jgi:RsmE family RNA methyltransferase|uniref:16S rRNA (uracil(1498)-N(3))-methyltransferase n=1 Tax=Marinobacterium litorale TaxID=404770 RepID=UPI00040B967B|nr:16S rRNA (uracil(1498)-N(3))-methyltransferase [Marinobacterium litorale]MBS97509.1 16S rRNA (uracil(1498)-N(3))-methyltransferase [Oceanospirillaceae bacterium]
MNLILLFPEDFTGAGEVRLHDRRLTHITEVHRAEVGDCLKVGMINGAVGQGKVIAIDQQEAVLRVNLTREPPAALPLTLIMALPRPKMFKRTLQTAATLGVKELWLINSYRVDKSYWGSPLLEPAGLQEHLLLGLEQAGDTVLPQVHLRKRFKPFVEDELPQLCEGKRALLAHPYDAQPCPKPSDEPTLLAVGPEGGFIPYEVEKLVDAGLAPIHLGSRILRVETAIPFLLAKLFPIGP